MSRHRPRRRAQPAALPGYTLTELLIVVMIAVLLMVVSLPAVKSVMEDARPREASRILNTTIFTAKARAAQTGRLAGIDFVMQRMNDPTAMQGVYQCTQMYMCEVPALYAGDTTSAVATIDENSRSSGTPYYYTLYLQDNVPTTSPPTPVSSSSTATTTATLVDQPRQASDMRPANAEDVFEIRFDHRGPWYAAQRGPSAGQFYVYLTGTFPSSAMYNANTNIYRYAPFQIRRPPVRVGNPVELPKSTAIDMSYSGLGPNGAEFGSATSLRVMFAPSGSVYAISMTAPSMASGSGTSTTVSSGAPLGTIHFLVGLTNKVNLPLGTSTHVSGLNFYDPEQSNLADANALWVSVGRSSGIVTTSENAPDYTGVTNPSNSMTQLAFLANCRQYATAREQKGGR